MQQSQSIANSGGSASQHQQQVHQTSFTQTQSAMASCTMQGQQSRKCLHKVQEFNNLSIAVLWVSIIQFKFYKVTTGQTKYNIKILQDKKLMYQ
jgi:hypothetical protein